MDQIERAHGGEDVERHRPRLFGIAYRMLGDVHEAEDIVQEGYFRWHRADQASVVEPEAWLVAVVTRLSIDRLRRAEHERMSYVGTWLPEPVETTAAPTDRQAEMASDLSMAFLVLLERLAPEERAAFLLREVFDTEYAEIARILDKSEPAVRQAVHRAKERVQSGRKRFVAPPEAQGRLLRRFLDAVAADDKDTVLALLAPDSTFTSDGGGKVSATRRVLVGPERIGRFFLGLAHKYGDSFTRRLVELNGGIGVLSYHGGRLIYADTFETNGEQIFAVYRVLNPDKLRHLARL
jgi:RNA polymerase sigma-70 factor, ECF subfamily